MVLYTYNSYPLNRSTIGQHTIRARLNNENPPRLPYEMIAQKKQRVVCEIQVYFFTI